MQESRKGPVRTSQLTFEHLTGKKSRWRSAGTSPPAPPQPLVPAASGGRARVRGRWPRSTASSPHRAAQRSGRSALTNDE